MLSVYGLSLYPQRLMCCDMGPRVTGPWGEPTGWSIGYKEVGYYPWESWISYGELTVCHFPWLCVYLWSFVFPTHFNHDALRHYVFTKPVYQQPWLYDLQSSESNKRTYLWYLLLYQNQTSIIDDMINYINLTGSLWHSNCMSVKHQKHILYTPQSLSYWCHTAHKLFYKVDPCFYSSNL